MPNKNKTFTPDELRVVLKWAAAYTPKNGEAPIGSDFMFPAELETVRKKIAEAIPEVVLGGLNISFLMGFDTLDSPYPLQRVWDGLSELMADAVGEEINHVLSMRLFLEGACLIKKS